MCYRTSLVMRALLLFIFQSEENFLYWLGKGCHKHNNTPDEEVQEIYTIEKGFAKYLTIKLN